MLSCKLPSLKDSVSVWDLGFFRDFLSAWSSSKRTTMTLIKSQKTTGVSFEPQKPSCRKSRTVPFLKWCINKKITCEAERRNAVRRCESKFIWLVFFSRASCERFGSVKTKTLLLNFTCKGHQKKVLAFPYHHRLHCALEDAASTSHTPLSPLSGCLCLHYPH